MKARLRVLVADDSVTVRKLLVEALRTDATLEVVGEAANGQEAIEYCRELRPDVVTLDMMMPVMTGLAATEYIMAYFPTPILIVSASTNRGELFRTYDALAAGAVDVLEKPSGEEPAGEWEQGFIASVKMVSRIAVITHPRARLSPQSAGILLPEASRKFAQPSSQSQIIAIGASTGGPGALVEVLRAIPPELPVPVIIVLHIAEPFGNAFADWLDSQSLHRVNFARPDETLVGARGRVVLAPPGFHLVVRGGRLRFTKDPERHSCRPSIDVLFESLAQEIGPGVIACLLTGMGRDGAAGLLAIRRAGGFTIAQDEATSVVYGMPREAVEMGAVDRVLGVQAIGPALASMVKSGAR